MNLSSMFPATRTLASTIVPTPHESKPSESKPLPSSLSDLMTLKTPGKFDIKWPKMRTQGLKNYKVITTVNELRAYIDLCETTGLGGFDYETSGDENHRMPPTDATEKELDSWTKSVNLDPWKANVCAMSLSAQQDDARAIFIDNPGSKQFEPTLSRQEARKLLFDILEERFFTNSKIVKIAVNLPFEEKFTAKYGKYILMPCADPFIAWIRILQLVAPNKIINPKKPFKGKGLKPMTKEIFGVTMSEFTAVLKKNNALFFDQVPNDGPDALSYCCEDSDYAVQHYLYWDEIAKQIPNNNPVYPTYSDWLHNIEMPFARVTGLMEYWGMYWDTNMSAAKSQEAEIIQEESAKEIAAIAKDNFNMDITVGKAGKTKDVKSFIFDTLKLPGAAWSAKTKEPSLDGNAMMDMIFMLENKLIDPDEEKYLAAALPEGWEEIDTEKDPTLDKATRGRVRIAQREPHPHKDIGIKLLQAMQRIQKYATLLSSHIEGREKYLNPVTNRIHAHYEPWTETARLSSDSPNGQNVPRPDNDELGVRNFYKAAPGKVLFLIDESGFELRLTAWKSNCPVMIPAFLNKEDLHAKTAGTMTGKDPKDVTKHERSGAKAGNFGSVYGGTEHALQKTFKKLGIRKSLPECKVIVDAVKTTYPGITTYQKSAVIESRETGYAETIFGYKRLLPHINSSNRSDRSDDERRSQNTPIQGSAADIMKLAQNKMYDRVGKETYEATVGINNPIFIHGHTDMIAQIHDEIIFEIDDDPKIVERFAAFVKEIMEIPPLENFPLPLEAEASIAYSWGQKKSLESWLKERGAASEQETA